MMVLSEISAAYLGDMDSVARIIDADGKDAVRGGILANCKELSLIAEPIVGDNATKKSKFDGWIRDVKKSFSQTAMETCCLECMESRRTCMQQFSSWSTSQSTLSSRGLFTSCVGAVELAKKDWEEKIAGKMSL